MVMSVNYSYIGENLSKQNLNFIKNRNIKVNYPIIVKKNCINKVIVKLYLRISITTITDNTRNGDN